MIEDLPCANPGSVCAWKERPGVGARCGVRRPAVGGLGRDALGVSLGGNKQGGRRRYGYKFDGADGSLIWGPASDEMEVGRHRHLCRVAIVRHGRVTGPAARRGIGPAAIRKEGRPCASVVKARSMFSFGSMRVGWMGNAFECGSTRRAPIQRSTRRQPIGNFTSGSTDAQHTRVRPMAAHQLARKRRCSIGSRETVSQGTVKAAGKPF